MTIRYQQWGDAQALQQILLIHGWGMNSAVWTDMAEYLQQQYPQTLIRAVDLPGYGLSGACLPPVYNSQMLAQMLMPLLQDKQTLIIAWSMGGLTALEMLATDSSLSDNSIKGLVLVSSTPCFVQKEGWPHAVEAGIFAEFSRSLEANHQLTLSRFLAIQALGSHSAREDIKTLQGYLFARGEPAHQALEQGLQILLKEDKRQLLEQINMLPIWLIAGEKDTLVKYQAQQALSQQANISLFSIASAGHAPFISHPEEFKQILTTILE